MDSERWVNTAGDATLPVRLTSFVGRETEAAEVSTLLDTERLVTLVGTGGCGKTRLALHVAAERSDRYEGRVWWVDLSTLEDDTLVTDAIASVLGIKETPGRTLLESLKAELRNETSLLMLDNCEHLVTACAAIVDELLRASPELTILATSREGSRVNSRGAFHLSIPPRRAACSPIAPLVCSRASSSMRRSSTRSPKSADDSTAYLSQLNSRPPGCE
jgi:predicted ATPase